MQLPCTTIAGRHAADRTRERANQPDPKLVALEALASLLRKRPLRVVADLRPRGDQLPTIALKVRFENFGLDLEFIDAALRDLDWHCSRTNLSRRNASHDIRILDHPSGAQVLLIAALPHGEVEHVEAA